eukprot:TRINITY_DN8881_c0_g2_i1.p1 TRINITY_DN8881_c0_g2~~TRINITY_DN8881_c0_g2_i1.p1  ORF type:complete len:360 (+),score=119.52 TRINITY_DN8881_c0_g2_i1:66-1082(+)
MKLVILVAMAWFGVASVQAQANADVNVVAKAPPVSPPVLSNTTGTTNSTEVAKKKKKRGKELAQKLRTEMEKKNEEKTLQNKQQEKIKKNDVLQGGVVPLPAKDLEEEEDINEAEYYSKGEYKSETVEVISMGKLYTIRTVRAKMENSKGDVLLLHGNAYTHTIWKDIDTMDRIREAGFRPISVDLPGKGLSQPKAPEAVRGQWLLDFIGTMGIKDPVVVAPSMAGTYALPVVLNSPGIIKGLVAIAPSGASKVADEQWRNVTIPVNIMFGANDPLAYVSAATMFRTIKLASRWKVANGTHAFYVNKGPEFNRRLVKFVKKVYSTYFSNRTLESKQGL